MSRGDWFRNTEWNEEIERLFFAKLARARRKDQYLNIQALTLQVSHPKISFAPLDNYFELKERWNDSSAFLVRARAHVALGDDERAIEAFEATLAQETADPSLKTDASIAYSFWIATNHHVQLYRRALEILAVEELLLFPNELFRRHAALALILSETGDQDNAQAHAQRALEMAEALHSGFRYHAALGLVGDKYEDTRASLTSILQNQKLPPN